MGRNENIKRMKRMRDEKKKRSQVTSEPKMDAIAAFATNSLAKKLSPRTIIRHNTRPIKYSEVLEEFVAPYMITCKDFEDKKKLLTVGSLVWNLAILKQSNGQNKYYAMIKEIEKVFKKADREFNTPIVHDFLNELTDRKLKYFSHHKVLYTNVEEIET